MQLCNNWWTYFVCISSIFVGLVGWFYPMPAGPAHRYYAGLVKFCFPLILTTAVVTSLIPHICPERLIP